MFYLLLNLLVGFFTCIFFLIYWKLIRTSKRIYDALRSQNVPGEPFVPIIGQIPALFQANKKDAIIELIANLVEKHGHYFVVGFGPLIRHFVMEPDMIVDILHRSHAQDYIKAADFVTIFKPIIGTHNLLVSEGAEHDEARKMLNPAFYFDKLKAMISIMIEQTTKAVDELLLSSANEQTIDLPKELNTLTLSIIVSSAFGKQYENQVDVKTIVQETFSKMLLAIEYRSMRMFNQIPILSKLPVCQKQIVDQGSETISRVIDQIITDRREGRSISLSSNDDLLDLLLSAVDSQGTPFNDQEIKDQALTFVFAGHETTGNLMTWITYILMTNNNVLRACQEEVDEILPKDTQLTYEYLTELNVCEAVIQEALRLYPPAPFLVRECVHEHTIGSEDHHRLFIPAKTTIVIDVYELHRRAEFWSRPLEFDYTRWLRDPVTGLKPKLSHPFCYLPFGAGPRNCIGQNFALLEARVILASLLQRCNFELDPGQKIVPDLMLNMRCKYGLKAKIHRR